MKVSDFFVYELLGRLNQKEEQHGDGQRHENRFEVHQGQIHDNADDGNTRCRGSF